MTERKSRLRRSERLWAVIAGVLSGLLAESPLLLIAFVFSILGAFRIYGRESHESSQHLVNFLSELLTQVYKK